MQIERALRKNLQKPFGRSSSGHLLGVTFKSPFVNVIFGKYLWELHLFGVSLDVPMRMTPYGSPFVKWPFPGVPCDSSTNVVYFGSPFKPIWQWHLFGMVPFGNLQKALLERCNFGVPQQLLRESHLLRVPSALQQLILQWHLLGVPFGAGNILFLIQTCQKEFGQDPLPPLPSSLQLFILKTRKKNTIFTGGRLKYSKHFKSIEKEK